MSEISIKSLKTRIRNKHDLEINWNNATFVPFEGELIIYDAEKLPDGTVFPTPNNRAPYEYPRFKFGDGKSTVGQLPFVLSEYLTESELSNLGYITSQSLADYAKKTDIPKVSDFLNSIPDEYITESELEAKGYLTQHQSLAGLATEGYVNTAIADLVHSAPETLDTLNELAAALGNDANFATTITNELAHKVSTADLADMFSYGTEDPSEAVTSQFYFKYTID